MRTMQEVRRLLGHPKIAFLLSIGLEEINPNGLRQIRRNFSALFCRSITLLYFALSVPMSTLTVLLRPLVILLALAVTCWCSGQNVVLGLGSAAGRPGDTVSLGISMTSGITAVAVEFALNYSATDFSAVSVSLGAVATAASKSLSCS